MGYRNDLRFLIPIENYSTLKNSCLAKHGEDSYFHSLQIEDVRNAQCGRIFVYFGLDHVSWDTDFTDDEDDEKKQIEKAVLACDAYHMVRIGENWDDLDEFYNLNDTNIDCIEVIRKFAA